MIIKLTHTSLVIWKFIFWIAFLANIALGISASIYQTGLLLLGDTIAGVIAWYVIFDLSDHQLEHVLFSKVPKKIK